MEINQDDFARYLQIIGHRRTYCIFGGKPEWNAEKRRYGIPRSSPKKRTEWIVKDRLVDVLKEYYSKGWSVWISLNDKATGEDLITGVRAISVFWFDFDAPRRDKSRKATKEEKESAYIEAEKFKKWMRDTFDVVGFLASSGNGYHLFYCITPYELPGENFRKEFNEKQRKCFKKLREVSHIDFDTTTDIKRVSQPIGGFNYKIPDNPIKTYWVDKPTDKEIDEARKKNLSLLTAVLDTKTEETPTATTEGHHPEFTELLEHDTKLKELYTGNWQKYDFKSRSEAEQSLVTILCMNGFSDDETKEIMKGCKIGKWQEKEESYHNATVKKGREFAANHPIAEHAKSDGTLHDTDYYLIINEKTGTVRINEKLFADDLMAAYHFKTIRDTEEVLYYEDGYYRYEGEATIGSECERMFGEYIKTRNVTEILNHIRRSTYIKRSELNKNKSVLPLENGLFDLTTHTISDFSPDVLITYKLPVEYNPNADCPSIKKFIEEILNPEDIPIIQEYFGYTLLPAFPAHKSLWMYGTGRNGKSQLISLLSKMLGDENTVSVPIEEFDGWHRFSTARLFGKLLNVTSEPGVEKPLKSGLFKKIVGGDKISAEIKGKQRTIDFVNFSKFIVLGNIFPQVTDPSLAFWDRLIVVEFPNSFVNDFMPDISEKLIKEDGGLSGFFNWCLEGLKRLEENSFKFATTKNTEEMKLEFEKLSNPVKAFINEECVISVDKKISKGELYNAYKNYCGDGNYKIVGKGEFSKRIGELRGVDWRKARYNGKVTHCWIGITLQNDVDVFDADVDVSDADVDVSQNRITCPETDKEGRRDRENTPNVDNVDMLTSISPAKKKERDIKGGEDKKRERVYGKKGQQQQHPIKKPTDLAKEGLSSAEGVDLKRQQNVNKIKKTSTPPKNLIFTCVCGKKFNTQKVLHEHQAKCREFQAKQNKGAKENLEKEK